MIDVNRKDAITATLRSAFSIFSGVCDPVPGLNFTMATLLLKYISDNGVSSQHQLLTDEMKADHALRFIVPKGAAFNTLFADRYQPDIGSRLDMALNSLEAANSELKDVFLGISFNDTVLGSTEQKNRTLGQLLGTFKTETLDFRPCHGGAEAIAAACLSLLRHASEAIGKRGGEFFTPPEISQLIARIMQPKGGESVFDPCCGSGLLLTICSQLATGSRQHRGCLLHGQEKNGSAMALARLCMILNGETNHQLRWGDSLRDPKFVNFVGQLEKFDIVVSSPPFSLRDWGREDAERDPYERYKWGTPPRAFGDYAFISHMIESLKPEVGRMTVVVSLGALFRGGAEREIREQLISENLIDAVIALPSKLLTHTSIQVALLVIRKDKADDNILFIDASSSYQQGKGYNVLRPEDVDLISQSYHAREKIDQYAQLATLTDIAANHYNLSVARYVNITEAENEVDITALRSERADLKVELADLESKLGRLLAELSHG